MRLIAWEPALSVKVKQFDNQHIKLVNMFNDLHNALEVGSDADAFSKLISGLISYTSTHFSDEELLMAVHSYPDSAAHKTEHEKLIVQVLDFRQKFISEQAIQTQDVMFFLKSWLVKHIQGDDRKFGVYLNLRGVY